MRHIFSRDVGSLWRPVTFVLPVTLHHHFRSRLFRHLQHSVYANQIIMSETVCFVVANKICGIYIRDSLDKQHSNHLGAGTAVFGTMVSGSSQQGRWWHCPENRQLQKDQCVDHSANH